MYENSRSASVRPPRRGVQERATVADRPRSQGPTPSSRREAAPETPRTMEERLREQRQRFRESKEALNRSHSRLASPRSVRNHDSFRSRGGDEESQRSPSITRVHNPLSPTHSRAHTVHKPEWQGSGLPTDSRLYEAWGARKSTKASPSRLSGKVPSTVFSQKLKESTPLALRSRRVSRDTTDRMHTSEAQSNGHVDGEMMGNQLDSKSTSPEQFPSPGKFYPRNPPETYAMNSPLFFGQNEAEENVPMLLQAINHFVHQFNQEGNDEQLRESERIIKSRLGNSVFDELLAGLQNAPSPNRQNEAENYTESKENSQDEHHTALQELQQRNLAHREKIVELQKAVQQLRSERDKARNESQQNKETIRELERKLRDTTTAKTPTKRPQYRKKLKNMQGVVNGINSAFDKLRADVQRYTQYSYHTLPETISNVLDETGKQDHVLSQLKDMMEQFSSSAMSHEDSERKVEQLANEKEELRRQLESEKSKQARHVKELQTQTTELQEELSSYKDMAAREREEKESTQERLKTEKNKAIDAQQQLEWLQQELARQKEETEQQKQEESETLRTENKRLESLLKHKDEELSYLNEQFKSVDSWNSKSLESLQGHLSKEIEQFSANLEYELKGVDNELKQKQVSMRSLEKEITGVTSRLPPLMEREKSRRQDLETEAAELRERVRNMEQEIHDKENNISQSASKLEELSSEVEQLRKEKEEKEQLSQQQQGTEEEKEALRTELQTTKEELREKEETLAKESKQVQELEENLQRIREQLQNREADHEELLSLRERSEELKKQVAEKDEERNSIAGKLKAIQDKLLDLDQSLPPALIELRIEYDDTAESSEEWHKMESMSGKLHELLTSMNKYKSTLKEDIAAVSKAMNYSTVQERLNNSTFGLADILELASTLLRSFAKEPSKSRRRSSSSRVDQQSSTTSTQARDGSTSLSRSSTSTIQDPSSSTQPSAIETEQPAIDTNVHKESNTSEGSSIPTTSSEAVNEREQSSKELAEVTATSSTSSAGSSQSETEATTSSVSSATVSQADTDKPPPPRPPPRPRDTSAAKTSETNSSISAGSAVAIDSVTGSSSESAPTTPTPPKPPAPPVSGPPSSSSSMSVNPSSVPKTDDSPSTGSLQGSRATTRTAPGPPPKPSPPPPGGSKTSPKPQAPQPPPSDSKVPAQQPPGTAKTSPKPVPPQAPPSNSHGRPQPPGSSSPKPQPPSNSPPKPQPPSNSPPKPQPPSNSPPKPQPPSTSAPKPKPPATPPKPKGGSLPKPPPSQSSANKPKPPSAPPPKK